MELIPKALVVGVLGLPAPSPEPVVTVERLNRVWADVAADHGYRQMQLAPDGGSAEFLGSTADDGVVIRLPLLQVRASIQLTAEQAATRAQSVFRSIERHIGIHQFVNLGIKIVNHGVPPNGDAQQFVLNRVLGKTDDDIAELQLGGPVWGGVKLAAISPDGKQHVTTIEPWLADNHFVFIDLDVQHQGPAKLDEIPARVGDADEYMARGVKAYLEKAGA